jgi:hypothetical protein
MGSTIRKAQSFPPRTLALMHGPSFSGRDGAAAPASLPTTTMHHAVLIDAPAGGRTVKPPERSDRGRNQGHWPRDESALARFHWHGGAGRSERT